MSTDLLIMNLRGSSWDYIPDDLWEYIVRGFVSKNCDSFSMDCLSSKEDIIKVEPFIDFQPVCIGVKYYGPYSIPSEVKDPQSYRHSLPAFEFNEYIAQLLLKVPFGYWNVENEDTPADELIFWRDDQEKVLAIPYEGMIYFYELTIEERDQLVRIDPRIKTNLRSVA